MAKLLIINSVCGYGSTGRIVAELSKTEGFDTLVCYGRKKDYANVNSYKFANFFDNAFAAFRTILFDNNLNVCTIATKRLVKKIKEYNPDIIHLHNVHGFYVNVELLFSFLKDYNKPIVWTIHDSWPITGYCSAIDYKGCKQYENKCENCPMNFVYPFSLFKQNLTKDFLKKKELFTKLENLTIVAPSNWTKNIYSTSFLKEKNIIKIHNGINLDKFYSSANKNNDFTVLAIANYWSDDKGGNDLQKVIDNLHQEINFVVVGSGSNRFNNCKTIDRTDNIEELIKLYSQSNILINTTLDDNLPTVNIESLACGTPVITYKTGGSPEIIDDKTGIVVEKGDSQSMIKEIIKVKNKEVIFNSDDCINRSKLFSKEEMKKEYKKLYESLLAK